jgi:hypothetical protein
MPGNLPAALSRPAAQCCRTQAAKRTSDRALFRPSRHGHGAIPRKRATRGFFPFNAADVIAPYIEFGEDSMERFESLGSFFRHFETPRCGIRIEEVDRLEERLRASGYSVREYKSGAVDVCMPDEAALARAKRLAAQRQSAAKFTKLGAAVPIEKARAFAAACRKLGVSQRKSLAAAIDETIKRADSLA